MALLLVWDLCSKKGILSFCPHCFRALLKPYWMSSLGRAWA